jgi:hypothetical protein
MKRRGEDRTLANENGLACAAREDFHLGAYTFDDGCANENHFERLGLQRRGLASNFAGELSAVGVAQHRGIEKIQRALRRIFYFAREQNCSGAGAENRAAFGRVIEERSIEPFVAEKFQHRGAFAAGEDHAVEQFEIARAAHEHVRDAKAFERAGMRGVIALNGEDSDFGR